VIAATDLCDEEELTRLRAYLDNQMKGLQSVVTGWPTGFSAG
jgi:cobaltochelatase CobT